VSAWLLDTSVLIGSRVDPDSLPTSAAISVISVGELRAGVHLADDDEVRALRSARLEAVRSAFAALPVDERVADEYGRVLALARRRRRTVKATDLLIIATAAADRRGLHTRDVAQAALATAAGIEVSGS
jgi:predicted nucleic acid-binding protein